MGLYRISELKDSARDDALNLADSIFDRTEAHLYSAEAAEFYHAAICGYRAFEDFCVYGAYKGEALAGVLVADAQKATICLLTVSESCRGSGVGSSLVKYFLTVCNPGGCTVNAVLSATEFYRSLGFRTVGEKKEENGFKVVKMYGISG